MQIRLFIAQLFEKMFVHANKALPEINFTERDNFPHWEFPVEWWYFSGFLSAGKAVDAANKKRADFAFEVSFFRAKNPFESGMLHIALLDLQSGAFYHGEIALPFSVQPRNVFSAVNGAAPVAKVVAKVRDNVLLFDEKRNAFLCRSRLVCSGVKNAGKLPRKRFAGTPLSEESSARNFNSPNKTPIRFGFSLKVNSVMLQGKNGVVGMAHGKGGSSYYITYPDMDVTGKISIGDKEFEVSGTGWHDHQFGIFTVFDSAWDWFSLRFDREKIYVMVFGFAKYGKNRYYRTMANVFKDGKSLLFNDVKITPEKYFRLSSGTVYPLVWKIRIFENGNEVMRFSITPVLKECEFRSRFAPTYWEGPCEVSGEIVSPFTKGNVHFEKQNLDGRAFAELVGYSR